MSAESVAQMPQCVECDALWLPADAAHWLAYWIDDGPDEKLDFYCPECSEREFRASLNS